MNRNSVFKIILLFIIMLLFIIPKNSLAISKKVYWSVNTNSIKNTFKTILENNNIDLYGVDTIVFNDIDSTGIEVESEIALDLSSGSNGSVMVYVVDNSLYIQFRGELQFNSASNFMFYQFSNIKSIKGLNYVNTSQVTNMSYMFSEMDMLEEIDVSGFDTSKVTTMKAMFKGDKKLKNIDVSNWNTSNVTDMSNMFYNASSITTLDLTNFNTSKVTNMEFMFYLCSSLTSIDIGGFDTQNVTNMSYMFDGCRSITSLDFSNFDTHNVTNMAQMFYGTSSITTLNLTNFNTRKVTDMYGMFGDMSNVELIDISSFEMLNVKRINLMFYNDVKLKTIYVSKGWDLSNWSINDVNNYERIFSHLGYSNSLVGGNGTRNTKGNSGNLKDIFPYLRIDSVENPGLFSVKYNLNSSAYDIEDNYIYIGIKDFNLNNIQIDNYETIIGENTDDHYISIYYNGMTLKQYPLVGISSKDYILNDNYILINDNTLDLEKIDTMNSTISIDNLGKYLNVSYNNNVVDAYRILKKVKYKIMDGLIYKIEDVITVRDFIATINQDTNINYILASTDLNEDSILKTGTLIKLQNQDEIVNFKLALNGDVNGDGKISALDYVKIKNHIMGVTLIEENVYLDAADYNDDSKISALDYVKIKNYIMNGGN